MASKEGKNVMLPEHAMKREMAHRHRLELLQLINNSNGSGKLPAPPTISQTSSPASRPTPATGPSQSRNMRPKLPDHKSANPGPSLPPRGPNPHPRPGVMSSQTGPKTKPVIVGPRPRIPHSPTSSLPRPKPSAIGPSTGPRPNFKPIPSSTGPRPNFKPTPSVSQRLGPTIGSTHKRKEAPTQQLQPHDHGGKMRKTICEVCEVQCTSADNLKMHLMGQKHQAAMKKGKKVRTEEEDDGRLYCSLCEIWCMNEFSLKQHLSGKNHIHKLHSAETPNKK